MADKADSDLVLRNRIVDLREEKDWSQAELARRVNLDKTALNKIEKGFRKVSTAETNAFANIFDVSTDYLLGRTEDRSGTNDDGKFDIADDSVLMTYQGKPLSKEDREMMLRIMRGKE